MIVLALQVVRTFFATLNAFSQATVGTRATDGDLFGAYDAVQHYMKFICMPKLSTPHLGSVCHASNHGTQVSPATIIHINTVDFDHFQLCKGSQIQRCM